MAPSSSEQLGVLGRSHSRAARSAGRSSELLGRAPFSELQAFLSPYNSAACARKSPLLRGFEVKNSELWLQIAPANAVCAELALPSLERVRSNCRLCLRSPAPLHPPLETSIPAAAPTYRGYTQEQWDEWNRTRRYTQAEWDVWNETAPAATKCSVLSASDQEGLFSRAL